MNYVTYFKNKKGFDRFFNELRNKYIKTGKFVGVIYLKNISEEESKDLGNFFGTIYFVNSNIKVSLNSFEKIMLNSKYNDFSFKNLLDSYFNIKIKTKFEQNTIKNDLKKVFFDDILKDSGSANKWLDNILNNKGEVYMLIMKKYNNDKLKLKNDLIKTINCLNNLPEEEVYLPIFASMYTKDPHYLDIDASNNTLFIYGLCFYLKENYPTNRSEKIELYLKAKIVVDPLSNYAVTYMLCGSKLLDAFCKLNEPLIINLHNVNNIKKIDTKNKKVFIFENPSILNILLQNKIDIPVIITLGNPNFVVYKILDKLVEEGNSLYYNGDFDPEGLLIAYKMKSKYKDKLNLFCYEEEDYKNCLSKNTINLSRIKKLDKIEMDELRKIKELIICNHVSGYQESNINNIVNYIKKLNN